MPGSLAVVADRLRCGEDMAFVEGLEGRRAAVTGRAEGHALSRHRRVGLLSEKYSASSRGNVLQRSGIDRLAGGGIGRSHLTSHDSRESASEKSEERLRVRGSMPPF